MATLSFLEARECVARELRAHRVDRCVETAALESCTGRVLAEAVLADRDSPALARSVRDGYAVRSEDTSTERRVIGEVRAGEEFAGTLGPGEAIEIMTGAPVPKGADSIVMVEHTSRRGDRVHLDRTANRNEFINHAGSECQRGDTLIPPGVRLNPSHVAVLAAVGCERARVYARPSVAILSTGDEVVPIDSTPLPYQVRNSNAHTVAAQVRDAGGEPWILPIAPDLYAQTRDLIEQGLRSDLLLLSGGVSAGKYDIVEKVLADLGAEFFFDRVKVQPGQPLVFGRVRDTFFVGLPGNPVSTMITFRLFGALAVSLLAGESEPMLPLLQATLTQDFRQKPGLTRFLPAHLDERHGLTPVQTQGSSDVIAAARANCFLVTEPECETWAAGDTLRVLLK